jgi:hypothetical protein
MLCPSADDMKKKVEACLGYGLVSAVFLVNFFRLHKQGERVGMDLVVYATQEVLRKTGLKIGDIKKTLKKYSDSAHVTAAFLLMGGEKSDLAHVLAGAEFLREFGEKFHLNNRTTPLLDPTTTWKVPSEYSLPVVEIGQVPDDALLAALAQEYIEKHIWSERSR